MEDVRVRFAPSPTGHLHIGNARTAILNWLFARHTKGKFILRIEDTDPQRSKDEYIHQIFEDLKWLKLDWDEGPDMGGEFGPYRQSERFEIYRKHAKQLFDEGKAYHCYCTSKELNQIRLEAIEKGENYLYNNRCKKLTEQQKRNFEREGRKPAIRFSVIGDEIKFNDIVKGEISFQHQNVSDFVIMRQEAIPTYNFAAVVDDGLMKISHVIRGDDHVSNTPRQILLYNALGLQVPQFAHIPMILGPDRMRLSKRHGATSLDEFQSKGYLPDALVNYLSLLSWSSESGDEILSVDRLIKEFDFSRISNSAAIFDTIKLNWLNGHYIRNSDVDYISKIAIPLMEKAGLDVSDQNYAKKIINVLKEKVDFLEEIINQAKIFYQKKIVLDDAEARIIIRKESSQKVLWSFLRELKSIDTLDLETFRQIMKTVQKETGIIGKDLWMPVRIALTGKTAGPELPAVVDILDNQKCIDFVQSVLNNFR